MQNERVEVVAVGVARGLAEPFLSSCHVAEVET